jgi:type I restriction enzyme S subunit
MNFRIPFNLNEQQQITEYLDEQCSKIDKKKELINKKVELLKEYKQSLIYEAVTGKIDIGEYNE